MFLAPQAFEYRVEINIGRRKSTDPRSAEAQAEHARVLNDPTLPRWQRVQTGCKQRLQAGRRTESRQVECAHRLGADHWTGHDGPIRRLAASPDGRLASADANGTMFLWDAAALSRKRKERELSDSELRRLWSDLAASEWGRAWSAANSLVQSPAGCVRIARTNLAPAPPRSPVDVPAAIRDLGSARFADRERATEQLREILRQAR